MTLERERERKRGVRRKKTDRAGRSKKSLFFEPENKYLAEMIRMDSPANARASIKALQKEHESAKTEAKKRRIEKAIDVTGKRARATLRRKNLSEKERREFQEIAKTYERGYEELTTKKQSRPTDSISSQPPVTMKKADKLKRETIIREVKSGKIVFHEKGYNFEIIAGIKYPDSKFSREPMLVMKTADGSVFHKRLRKGVSEEDLRELAQKLHTHEKANRTYSQKGKAARSRERSRFAAMAEREMKKQAPRPIRRGDFRREHPEVSVQISGKRFTFWKGDEKLGTLKKKRWSSGTGLVRYYLTWEGKDIGYLNKMGRGGHAVKTKGLPVSVRDYIETETERLMWRE